MSDTLEYVKQHIGHGIVAIGASLVAASLVYKTSFHSSIIYQNRSYTCIVKKRILKTIMYFKCSYLITVISGGVYKIFGNNDGNVKISCPMSHLFALASTSLICQKFPISHLKNLGVKHLALVIHSITLGLIMSPMFKNDKSFVSKVLILHFGSLLGFTTIAIIIPSNKHVKMKKIYFGSLITILLVSIVGRMIEKSSLIYRTFYIVEVYGGYFQFALNYIIDVQAAVDKSKDQKVRNEDYDPLANSLSLIVNSFHLLLRTNSIMMNREEINTALSS